MQSTGLTPHDSASIGAYERVMRRYDNLTLDQGLPLMAIRLLCLRYGFRKVALAAVHVTTDATAQAAWAEIDVMIDFIRSLIERFPPSEARRADLTNTLVEIEALHDDPAIRGRLETILRRMTVRMSVRQVAERLEEVGKPHAKYIKSDTGES